MKIIENSYGHFSVKAQKGNMNNTNSADISKVTIGTKLKVRKSIFTVTGTNKRGFIAQQEYAGKTHTVEFPLSSFPNPHLMPIEIV